MIKVIKVDKLKKKMREVLYPDLNSGDGFVFDSNAPSVLRTILIKTEHGHFSTRHWCEYSNGDVWKSNKVIPVDAEINWAYRDGGSQ